VCGTSDMSNAAFDIVVLQLKVGGSAKKDPCILNIAANSTVVLKHGKY
jgi:hypothetical protein